MLLVGSSGNESLAGSCLYIFKSSCLRCMGSMMVGVSLPVLWMSRCALIRSMSVFICSSNDLILVWCIKGSVCKKRNLLAVCNGFNWFMILSIISFKKEMVLIIWLILRMFSLIKPLEMLVMDMTSFKIFDWSTWLLYNIWISCFIESTSSSSAVPNNKLNNPPQVGGIFCFYYFRAYEYDQSEWKLQFGLRKFHSRLNQDHLLSCLLCLHILDHYYWRYQNNQLKIVSLSMHINLH